MVVALQFHKGDKEEALDLANLIADLEPEFNPNVTFVLWAARNLNRVKNNPDILAAQKKLSDKFKTYAWDSMRRGDGYPHGPNDMWYEINQRVFLEKRNGNINPDCLFTIEADACPTTRDWLAQIYKEWRECGKEVLGCISTFNGEQSGMHVNGNMVLPIDFCVKHQLVSCPTDIAWDVYHREVFVKHAVHSNLIWNEYKCTDKKADQYIANPKSLPIYLHGYKGEKIRKYIRHKYLLK